MYFGKLRKPEPSPPNPGFCTLKVALNEPDFESGSRKLIETKSDLKKEEERVQREVPVTSHIGPQMLRELGHMPFLPLRSYFPSMS